MRDMKVLLVSPTTELDYRDEEIAAVVNYLKPTLLSGNVGVQSLLEHARLQWDLIWIASHGTEKGILLSDGILPISQLTTIIRSSGAKAMFINTCDSLSSALSIHDELGISIVCTVSEVPDLTAYITGESFARHIAAGENIQQAYESSKPGDNKQYIYLHGRDSMTTGNYLSQYKSFSQQESNEVLRDLRQLIVMVRGDDDLGHIGMLERMESMQNEMSSFRTDYQRFLVENNEKWNQLQSSLRFYRAATFLMAGAYTATLIAILTLLINGLIK